MKPFVKWAGGKTQFLEIIKFLSPKSPTRLVELFVGGGAFFLNNQPQQLIINDINKELIISYQTIKNNPQKLVKLLTEYENKHSQEFYESLKKQEPKNLTDLETAARFIYLNKTCYNGLYRVNSQGIFNVPCAKVKEAKLFDEDNILAISDYLNKKNCQILNQDYQNLLPLIKEGDFLFVDPPYDSERNRSFSYTASQFTQKNQQELLIFLKECEKKGAKWLLTNHPTTFIKELYEGYWQFNQKTQRLINCRSKKRVGEIYEVFVGSYPLDEKQKKRLSEGQFDNIQNKMKKRPAETVDYVPLKKLKKPETGNFCAEVECYWKTTPFSNNCDIHTCWCCHYNPNNFNVDDANGAELKVAINNLETLRNAPIDEALSRIWDQNKAVNEGLLIKCKNRMVELGVKEDRFEKKYSKNICYNLKNIYAFLINDDNHSNRIKITNSDVMNDFKNSLGASSITHYDFANGFCWYCTYNDLNKVNFSSIKFIPSADCSVILKSDVNSDWNKEFCLKAYKEYVVTITPSQFIFEIQENIKEIGKTHLLISKPTENCSMSGNPLIGSYNDYSKLELENQQLKARIEELEKINNKLKHETNQQIKGLEKKLTKSKITLSKALEVIKAFRNTEKEQTAQIEIQNFTS